MKTMKVDNVAFLVNRLGADMPVSQQYRELNQNAIEAIARRRAGGDMTPGRVVWDIDWDYLNTTGVAKLMIADNGDGMTEGDMSQYLNRLAVRGANNAQGMQGNFGVGAKIAALARNPKGLFYRSWRASAAAQALLCFDQDSASYGISADRKAHAIEMPPRHIGTSGTVVTLMGATDEEQTIRKPEGMNGHDANWLIRYLNCRYFRLPGHVSVQVRRFPVGEQLIPVNEAAADAANLRFEQIYGMQALLDGACEHSGTVSMADADVHWWLMEDLDTAKRALGWRAMQPGHVGIVYQNEVYVLRSGAAARRMLAAFGIHFGADRVVLHIEPKEIEGRVLHCDTARTRVMIDGRDVEEVGFMDAWGSRFKAQMPDVIAEMMHRLMHQAADTDPANAKKRIKDRLDHIKRLLNPALYRRIAGKVKAGVSTGPVPLPINLEANTEGGKLSNPEKPLPKLGVGPGSTFLSRLMEKGLPATPETYEPEIPDVVWVSVANGLRAPDERPEMAAWIEGDTVSDMIVKVNADFRGFQDLMRFCAEEFAPGADEATLVELKILIQDRIALQIAEVVVAIRNLHNGETWDRNQIQTALSPAALTALVLARANTIETIAREWMDRRVKAAA